MIIKYGKVKLIFFGRLKQFKSVNNRNFLIHEFIDRTSVKDLIESYNIPHTEIDVILVNGKSVGFDYLISDGDEIKVYPDSKKLEIKNLIRLKPKTYGSKKFICDVHLGKLARDMRILGLDVIYNNSLTDDAIIELSQKENRIILTRDSGLLKRSNVRYGMFILSNQPDKQLIEVLKSFKLKSSIRMLSRCLNCGKKIKRISKKLALIDLSNLCFPRSTRFYYCENCNKYYWNGSHYDRIVNRMKKFLLKFQK